MARITKQMQLDGAAISEPGIDNYRCQQCQLCNHTAEPFRQPDTAHKTVIVSSSPIDIPNQLWYDIRFSLFKGTTLSDENVTYMTPTLCVPYRKKITALQMRMCKPFVESSLSELKPRRILIMGANAVKQFVDEKASIRSLTGKALDWNGIPLHVTYDPSAAMAGKPEYLVSIKGHITRMMKGLKNGLPKFPGWRRA